ncbi:MAG: zinc ribbon domain-containing protein [Steroidobacteraceae bacterium]|nr:zinc ribbon domain-containing protein [Steroidobacteraceae bacterium]
MTRRWVKSTHAGRRIALRFGRRCRSCGAEVSSGAKFCRTCGQPLTAHP